MGVFDVLTEMESFYQKITIFTSLKKLITILIIIFGITCTTFAQLKPNNFGEMAAKVVKFYPNPATTAINFELPEALNKSYTLQLYNFMGKKVDETNTATPRVSFSLDRFYRGVYIYQLRDKYGKIVDSGKFQVVK
jgi:uncharacterized protein YxeA